MRQQTLQEQYNLIVEGKGNVTAFHKQALKQFPHLFTAQSSFDQVVNVLKQKSIISEMIAQGLVSNSSGPNFFEIFNTNMAILAEEVKAEDLEPGNVYDYKGTVTRGPKEGNEIVGKLKFNKIDERNPDMFIFTWVEISGNDNGTKVGERFFTSEEGLSKYVYKKDSIKEAVDAKATLKQTDKSVEDKETAGYDYKDKKNINNQSGAEFLLGFYVESRNSKNVDKTVEEIRDIVVKNLAKDQLHYVKSGQFGVEGLGYSEDHPGLGPTKVVKGKYASSGMEPVKLKESKQVNETYGNEIDVPNPSMLLQMDKERLGKVIDKMDNNDMQAFKRKFDQAEVSIKNALKDKLKSFGLDKAFNLGESKDALVKEILKRLTGK